MEVMYRKTFSDIERGSLQKTSSELKRFCETKHEACSGEKQVQRICDFRSLQTTHENYDSCLVEKTSKGERSLVRVEKRNLRCAQDVLGKQVQMSEGDETLLMGIRTITCIPMR
ncbi:hypothetical protein TNIN_165261 [Trichonephila inaurata madagascariensis]|uniref:Uncharacterized protein n=1 Tax=Trichonephila inaurata madagascariensis TaxID=2747483 RepID=A0A8X6JCY9_9ARAC|nr:hypothetical protein TNIN_165261 [Trichonephila inaurata madagascariensis]